jgi:aspartyl-tRNA(Asn)/glutamyl-tRNA(Gln) amidotransferase subunit A
MSLHDLTIVEAAARLREGHTSSVELLDTVLDRAHKTEAQLHAYLTIDRQGARKAAEAADGELAAGQDRGSLHGIPVALKDNLCSWGLETTASSQILAGY